MNASQNASILIVDDVETTRRSLGQILSLEGYQVHLAANGEIACSLVYESLNNLRANRQTVKYDLMILDINMPVMDGMTALQHINAEVSKIRANPADRFLLKYVPDIILLTAYGTMGSVITALRSGAVDFLEKPVSPVDMLASITKNLEKRREIIRQAEELEKLQAEQARQPANPSQSAGRAQPPLLRYADLVFDTTRREISSGKTSVHLTISEGKLMETLFSSPGRVFSHVELVKIVQGYDEKKLEAAEILRPLVSRLRQKLESLSPKNASDVQRYENWITNVRSTGYVFEKPEIESEPFSGL